MGSKRPGESNYDWIVANKDHDGVECLVWPFSRVVDTGRGQVGHDGKVRRAHRLMCEIVNGPPPSPEHHAAHECGNGHLGCINPKHLSWKTPSENQQDRTRHGRRKDFKRKLTTTQVAEIILLENSDTKENIAKRYGVSRMTVSKIHGGHFWKYGIQKRPREIRRILEQMTSKT